MKKISCYILLPLVVLFAVAFFTCKSHLNSKRVEITKSRVIKLKIALEAYKKAYKDKELPIEGHSSVMPILLGNNIDNKNPRQIKFIELYNPKKILGFQVYSSPLDSRENYLDGWGKPINLIKKNNSIQIISQGKNNGFADDIEATVNTNEKN